MSFDIAVEGQPFVTDLDSLSGAISAFLQLCFVAHLEYPQVTTSDGDSWHFGTDPYFLLTDVDVGCSLAQ